MISRRLDVLGLRVTHLIIVLSACFYPAVGDVAADSLVAVRARIVGYLPHYLFIALSAFYPAMGEMGV